MRGDRWFFAMGGLYVLSEEDSVRISQTIEAKWPFAIAGRAFRRKRLFRQSSPTVAPQADVLISGIGRLGNSILQVINASRIATQIGGNRVFFHRFDYAGNRGFPLSPLVQVARLTFKSCGQNVPSVIWRTDALFPGGTLFDPCAPATKSEAAHLSTALRISGDDGTSKPLDLAIYLRGGDIFKPRPHSGYGQPPLAFYLRVLEHRQWKSLTLVSEDRLNPCHQGITEWARQKNLPVQCVGERLDEAVRALTRAHTVVLGNGTFAPAVTLLSSHKQNFYAFEKVPLGIVCTRDNPVEVMVDLEGIYTASILDNNWSGSEAQLELMLSYPLHAVGKQPLPKR
jgi:hypothetical protein